MTAPPRALQALVGRYDAAAFEPAGGARARAPGVSDGEAWDAVLAAAARGSSARTVAADAMLAADEPTWERSRRTCAAGWAPSARAA